MPPPGADPRQIAVRVQALNGTWETLGADRYRGVVPENVQFTFNDWGPDTCSFVLRRDPTAVHPDLTTWTPVEVEVAGVVAWDGRLKETPTQEGDDPTISVQAEGWQYHLDDDVYQASYLHTRLTDFVDERSLAAADLTTHLALYDVQVGEGVITLMWPNAATAAANTGCAAVLDLGPKCAAITVSVDVSSSFNSPVTGFYVIGSDTPDWINGSANRQDWKSGLGNTDATFVSAGTVVTLSVTSTANPHRYITLLMFTSGGTAGADIWFKVTGLRAYAASGYQSAGQSVLKADVVVKDAIARAAPLLSADVSNVAAGTFSIPEFALDGNHTPREVIDAVNAYENYETRMLVGRKMAFRPRASSPAYEIGAWSGAAFQDASANSGDGIYNRVIVQGTGPDGAALAVDRYNMNTLALAGVMPNPSATSGVANWTVAGTGATLVQATPLGMSAPFAFQFNHGGSTIGTTCTSDAVAQTFLKNGHYRLSLGLYVVFMGLLPSRGGIVRVLVDGVPVLNATFPDGTSASPRLLDWVQPFAGSSYQVQFSQYGASNGSTSFDDVYVYRSVSTLIDRRGFQRSQILPVDSAITLTSGARVADLYLAAHKTTPFRGGFQAVGQGGVRRVLGGATVHPALLDVGQRVRCAHRIDPDTGAWSRDGTIATVAYNHDTLTSTVSLDENRAGFETLLSRLSVVTSKR